MPIAIPQTSNYHVNKYNISLIAMYSILLDRFCLSTERVTFLQIKEDSEFKQEGVDNSVIFITFEYY